jgi:hypothetical protein
VRLSEKGRIAALATGEAGKTVLWVANLTADEIVAEIPAVSASSTRIVLMNADAFERLTATSDFLEFTGAEMSGAKLMLDAYAVARITIN